uniref:Acyl-CoA dehydrogenase member 11 n=1 Tax=Sphaerodactylus townsendi TaxID=933632 RepID=A0ACB8FU06_9SAUR
MAAEPDTTEVRERHRFDQGALEEYLCQHLPGFPLQPPGALLVRQYSSGQSNPTFYLRKGLRSYVLRKKPHGPLLPQAHKIDREYRVQKALFAAGFPVAEPLLYCSDASVIGAEFYMMQHVQGRIFRNLALPGVSPAERSALYIAAAETLARLHSFSINSLGLQDFGRGPGYCKRQVSTWRKQYQAAAHTDIPAMNDLAEWLMNNLPARDDEEYLIHGDFRIDNIIFHPTEARVIAVLDWELSTTGHPMADFAYSIIFYVWPKDFRNMKMKNMQNLNNIAGNLDSDEFAKVVEEVMRTLPGVYARYLLGNSAAENSHEFGNMVKPLAEKGLHLTTMTSFTTGSLSSGVGELFPLSQKGQDVLRRVKDFMKKHVFPAQKEMTEYYVRNKNSPDIWKKPVLIEKLKEMAKAEGLWNLFLPAISGLGQVDYALIAEETGKCFFASEVFNCQAPG